jgi:cyclopropane fatty-acyl-phospholipid synthase-like methyltransferase
MSDDSLYDRPYRRYADYFGSKPDNLLTEHYHFLDKGKPILDLGAGQGRHALFLASEGYRIDAVEPSSAGSEMLREEAKNKNLPIRVFNGTFESFEAEADFYSGILLFGLIQELPWESIHLLLDSVNRWCCSGGNVFVSAFRSDDQSLARSSEWEQIGRNSFRIDNRIVRTFLEPNEILKLFESYKAVYHREGLGPEHRHGDGPLERHASIRAVFRKV